MQRGEGKRSSQLGDQDPLAGTAEGRSEFACSAPLASPPSAWEGGRVRDISPALGTQISLLREETTFPSTDSSTLMWSLLLPPPPPREARKKEQALEWGPPRPPPLPGGGTLAEFRENWAAPLRVATGPSFRSCQKGWDGITHCREGRWQWQVPGSEHGCRGF